MLEVERSMMVRASGMLAAAALIVGCSTSQPQQAAKPDNASAALTVAPDFTLKTPSGATVHLAEVLKKNRAVLVNFWSYN